MLSNQYAVSVLCKVLNISRSSFYYCFHKEKKLTKRELENQSLRCKIIELYTKADKRYGAVKIRIKLSELGINISVGRVKRLMNKMTLPKMSTVKPPKYRAKECKCDVARQNIVHQSFNTETPNQKWVSDITYIQAGGKWYYLCIIMDMFARKIIAWKISSRINKQLTMDTLKQAYESRDCPKGIIFHSDRGSQYTSKEFRQLLDEMNFLESYSKKGYPYDNAVAESFFKFLKRDEVYRRNYTSKQEMERAIFSYIEGFYNNDRPHSANNNKSPNKKEALFFTQKTQLLKASLQQLCSSSTVQDSTT